MPELPETETIARDLNAAIAGSTIVEFRVTRSDVLREVTAAAFRRRVRGTTILRVWRRAKLVVLDAGDPGVVVERALAPDGLQQILRKNLDALVAAASE